MASKKPIQQIKNYHLFFDDNPNKQKNKPNKKRLTKKELLYRLFHPDYILFDWEFFSRESEFE